MELYIIDRDFNQQRLIDKFHSAIWTERYYGDSEFELTVPTTVENAQLFKPGVFIGLANTPEIQILETAEFDKDGRLKLKGNSLLKWLNNRFVRTTDKHEDRYWQLSNPPGSIMAMIVYYMCIGGPYMDGSKPTGVPNPSRLIVPGLYLGAYDTSGDVVAVGVPFGPVFDATREIATTYEIGQNITLVNLPGNPLRLKYRNYKGINRTTQQSANPPVRFSSDFDSLTDIEEIQSIAEYKTAVYVYAPGLDDATKPLAGAPGMDQRMSGAAVGDGFDLRAQLVFAEDITTDQIEGNAATLLAILNSRAKDALSNALYIRVVDGEIVPTAQFKYGRDYNLGDLIEMQGNSGAVQTARVTEYIRVQDEAGERAYPTVTVNS